MDMFQNHPLPKTLIPPLPKGLFSRPRLLERLRTSLIGKLTLITAPPGYGKTSALLDLVYHGSTTLAWLTVDEADRHPERLCADVSASLSRIFPRLSASRAVSSPDAAQLALLLARRLPSRPKRPAILVLDNYHLIADAPGIPDFIQSLLERSPANFRLILLTRQTAQLPGLAELIARGQVDSLNLADLAFQPEELLAFLEERNGLRISPAEAAAWIEQTEGWIQGLLLSLDLPATAGRSAPNGLSGYFSNFVVGPQPEEIQEFLLRSACLREFNVEMCREVLEPLYGSRDWAGLLETSRRSHLFLLPADAEGRRFRYHAMFEQYLRDRLEYERPGEERRILLQKARHHAGNREWEKAHDLFVQLGDLQSLAGLLNRAGARLLQGGRHQMLGRWLDELPEETLIQDPDLISLKGAVLSVTGRVNESLELLNRAVERLRGGNQAGGLALALARRSFALRYLGRYARSLEDAGEAIRLAEGQPGQEAILAEACRSTGLGFHRLGEIGRAIASLRVSLDLSKRAGEEAGLPMAITDLGMVLCAAGDYAAAETYYDQALALLRRENNLTGLAGLYNNLGGLYHAQGKYQRAVTAFERGLRCARTSECARMEALLLAGLADLYSELGEAHAAGQLYAQAGGIADSIQDRFIATYVKIASAGLERSLGRLAHARDLLRQAGDLVGLGKSSYEAGLYRLECGRLNLADGNPTMAVGDLETARALFEKGGLLPEELVAAIWLCAARAQAGQAEPARADLFALQRHCEHGPAAHALCLTIWRAAAWLAPLQSDSQVGRTLTRLLSRGRQIHGTLPGLRATLRHVNDVAALPPPALSIRAFGGGQVFVHGRLIGKADWQTQSVRDLFFYILEESGGVTKEHVGVDFWPDVSPAQLKLRFKNAIYRLRRAIGPEAIHFEDDRYSFDRSVNYEYDVEAFHANLVQARHSDDPFDKINLLEAALKLVRGSYLDDVDASWIAVRREQLELDVHDSLVALANLYLQTGQHNRALAVCDRAIRHDGFMEEAYRLSMRAHAALGDRPSVARRYQTCRKVLQEELGLDPSPETRELYEDLMQ